MKTRFVFVCLLMIGCAHGVTDPLDPPSPTTDISDAGMPEAATVYSVPVDAGMDTTPGYNACVTSVTKATAYPRLTERICTDSNGSTYTRDMFDSQLSMGCVWRLTNDQNVHCVPENEQSSPEYADYKCTVMLGLVAVKADRPYVGLDTYTPDGGGSYVTYYNIGKEFTGESMYYSSENDDGTWSCNEEAPIGFLGIKTYYVGDPLDPVMFVQQ